MYLAPEKYIILGNGLSTPAVTKFSTKTVVFISFLLGGCTTQEETGVTSLYVAVVLEWGTQEHSQFSQSTFDLSNTLMQN